MSQSFNHSATSSAAQSGPSDSHQNSKPIGVSLWGGRFCGGPADAIRQELAALEAIEFDVVDLDTVLKAATLRHGLEGVRFELEWIERVRRDVADYAAKAGESEGRDGERDGGDG